MIRMLFSALLILLITSCATTKRNKDQGDGVLFTVSGETVPSEEFIYTYKKNNINNDSAFTNEDIDHYLDLFINFKLKIKTAKEQGLDTTETFKTEYKDYLNQLTEPYLSDKHLTDQLVKEAYERMKKEVSVSHILIRISPYASPEDTLKAFQKIEKIRGKAVEGTPFSELAANFSEEPRANLTKGRLGYFSAFQMVYPFETAAYNTPIGKVSKIFRTRFGYHILKVHDKRKSRGKVKVSHIMLRYRSGMSKEDSSQTANKIFEIYQMLKAGADWEEVCRNYSEDVKTKNSGGLLPVFGTGRMIPSFEEVAFSLDTPGEISDPFVTPYGWHVIRLEEKLELEPFEKIKNDIIYKVKKDSRSKLSDELLMTNLKEELAFQENVELKRKIFSLADSSLINAEWVLPSYINHGIIFHVNGKEYHSDQFINYVYENQKKAPAYSPEYYMDLIYNNFLKNILIREKINQLEKEDLEFRMLKKEYKEGILLFQLMEKEVWNKAVQDSVGLMNFYQSHKEQYKEMPKAEMAIFHLKDPSSYEDLKDYVTKNKKAFFESEERFRELKKELNQQFNAKSTLTLQVRKQFKTKEELADYENFKWEAGLYRNDLEKEVILILINRTIPERNKEFDEIEGQVISDYQEFLEKKWINKLREKYEIDLNERELRKVYDELQSNN